MIPIVIILVSFVTINIFVPEFTQYTKEQITKVLTVLTKNLRGQINCSLPTKKIVIQSARGGWTSYNKELVLFCDGDKYFYNNITDKKEVDRSLINNLIEAVNEPVIGEFNVDNFGITQELLDENVDVFIESLPGWIKEDWSEKQFNSVKKAFTDIRTVKKIIENYYLYSHWTDDYPTIDVTIQQTEGDIKIISKDQHFFMIPFEISKNGVITKNYNHHISKGIADLLPDYFPNKDRLMAVSYDSDGVLSLIFSAMYNHVHFYPQ